MLDPYVEYQKETRRTIVNKELMMLYGEDVTGYLPPLPNPGRPKTCIVGAWACGNPAMRQMANTKRRGPRNTDLHAAFHQRRPATSGEPERPQTALTNHVRSVLNTKVEEVQRPHTSAGKLESLPFSKKLAPVEDPEGLIVPPKVDLLPVAATQSNDAVDTLSLPGGLRKPRLGRGNKRKKSARVRDTGFPNLDQKWSQDIKRVLAGDMEELPWDVPSSTVKIYVCGTGPDLHTERDVLQTSAYPALREYCQQQGVELEIVNLEMQGGAATDPQQRLRELHRCQKESVGPYMVALLGDCYGPCHPPATIPSTEFGKLRSMAVDNMLKGSQLIDQFYMQDSNALPQRCVFQHDQPITAEESTELSRVLDEASSIMVQINKMTAERQQYYNAMSGVEREIRDTLGSTVSHPSTKLLCLSRSFTGLQTSDPTSATYVDVTRGHQVDTELHGKLENLQELLQTQLGEKGILSYDVPWCGDGVQKSNPDHEKYLEQFAGDFVNSVKQLIELNRKHTRVKHKNYPLFREVLQHSHQCTRHRGMFSGREGLLSEVEEYIKADSRNCSPLVVHGLTGTGRSALMSAVVGRAKDWLGASVVSVCRYINTTEDTADICSLLYGICHQLAVVYNLDIPPRAELSPRKLAQVLLTHLEQVSKHHGEQRPLLVALDDIDQLSAKDRADTLYWLPMVCPSNVYIIVSTHSARITPELRKRVPNPSNFMEVDQLLESEIEGVLNSMLEYHSWSLSTTQRLALVETCRLFPNPLYMSVMVAHALDWHSWTQVMKDALPNNTEDALMKQVFTLEDDFGPKLVDCTLGCLCLFQHGVSNVELLDMACSDEGVLKELFRLHQPMEDEAMTLLSSLLSSLLHKLQPLLHHKCMHGTVLLSWAHPRLKDLCMQKVFGSSEGLPQDNPAMSRRYQKLLSLFSQESGLKRSIKIARNVQPKQVDCQVRPQPTLPSNLRKLHLFPLLLWGTDAEEGKMASLKQNCLCCFDWLLTKLSGMGVDEVLADYKLYERRNREVDLVKDFLLLCREGLAIDATSLAQQLLGCMPTLDEEIYPLVSAMMEKAQKWFDDASIPTLVPVFPCFPSPLNSNKVKAWNAADVLCFDTSGCLAVVRNKEGFTEVWDMENYEWAFNLGIKRDKVTRNIFASDRRVLGVDGMTLKIWEVKSGLLEVNMDLGQFVGKKTNTVSVFCTSTHFDLVTLLTSDADFNQSVTVIDTATKSVVYTVNTFDVKDEFLKESASFAGENSLLVFVNARSQVLDNDSTVDVVKLNVHDLKSKKKLYITPCGENKLHKIMLKDNLVILGWHDCSFDIYAVSDGSHRWHLSAPDSHLYMQCYDITEDGYMVALTTTTRGATQSQWALWFWNIEENASGQLLCEPYIDPEDEPHHMLVMEHLRVVVLAMPGTSRLGVWDLPTTACITTFQAHTDGVDSLVKCPVDRHRFYSGSIGEGVVKLWDLYSILSDFKHTGPTSRRKSSDCPEFRHRASSVVSISGLAGILKRPGSSGRSGSAKSVRFSEEPISAEEILAGDSNEPMASQGVAAVGVVWVSISGDDRYMVCGSDQRLATVWDLQTGMVVSALQRQTGLDIATPWAEFAAKDQLVVGLSMDAGSRESYPYVYRYQVWERDTGRAMFPDVDDMIVATACTVMADRERVILSCLVDTSSDEHSDPALTFKVIRIADNALQHEVTYATGVIPTAISVTADGRYAITTSTPPPPARNETFTVFLLEDLGEAQPKPLTYKFEKGKKHKEYRPTGNVLLPNGLAVATGMNGDLQLWDITNGEYEGNLFEDVSVKETRDPSLHNHGGKRIHQMALSLDGRYLVCGAGDARASLWDLENEVRVHVYGGHSQEISAVCISADNALVLTASTDQTVCVWSFGATDKPLCRIYTHVAVKTLRITGDKRSVVMTGARKNEPSVLMVFRLCNVKDMD